ncbi:MAG: hypothetical protein MK098_11005 [Marinovum sp.]|nr:hypothetical protein [Marinovum sp.]
MILNALGPASWARWHAIYRSASVGWGVLFVLDISPGHIFGELCYFSAWQMVFAIDNSILLWTAGLLISAWRGWWPGVALARAAFLHIAWDFPLHHEYGRAHFWPLPGWIYESPLSYWDSDHNAAIIAAITGLISMLAAFPFVAGSQVF